MNKQLINKYKAEFDHWLNGGSILIRSMDYEDYKYTQFEEIGRGHKWENFQYEQQYIINDEYVEFRKALAEGKIIQLYDVIEQHLSNPSLDQFNWRDFKSFTASSSFSKTPDLYRIKPDEPKFKVGDFVRYIHHSPNTLALQIDNINYDKYYFVNSSMSCLEHELIPWTPVKGEWCWFYDNTSNKYSTLAQFKETGKNDFRTIIGTCEPFLNCKPSYLKDK